MSAQFLFEPQELRRRLHTAGMNAVGPDEDAWTAAVLLPILGLPDCPSLLFTRRADHLKHHGGQISFPGGQRESFDENPMQTALRETWEEVGIAPAQVEILGALDSYRTGTGFVIAPVVAVVDASAIVRIDPGEVARTFSIPLNWLYRNVELKLKRAKIHRRGRIFDYYSLRYGNFVIWGATAAILRHFLAVAH